MTPRERLEAAGMCSDCESNQCAAGCRCPCHQKNANQAAQLARDEAKETSDGDDGSSSAHLDGDDRTSPLDTVVPDKAAPVATSVSAPDLAQKFHEAYERLAPQFGYETRKASAKPWAEVPENNRKLMTAVCEEILKYTSSSSAAPDILTRILRSDMEQFSAEAERLHTENTELRDSRDRLQEALREAQAELNDERVAHERIAEYLLPLVGTCEGTSVDIAKRAAEDIKELRAKVHKLKAVSK